MKQMPDDFANETIQEFQLGIVPGQPFTEVLKESMRVRLG